MTTRKKSSAMKEKKEIIVLRPNKGGRQGKPKIVKKIDGSRNPKRQASVAAAYATGNSGRAPIVQMSRDSCRVIHRELLGNVSGGATAAFTVNSTFALNPGLPGFVNWLSNMAQNWETYRFRKLRFCYYTRTGTGTKGSVIMAPDYDASDAAPVSEKTLSSYEDVREDAVWKDIICVLREGAMHPVGARKFVRSGALSANQDIKLYDVGNFYLCTADSSTAEGWGKLWVEYDVEFFTPQLFPAGSNFSTINTFNSGAALSQTAIFGTSAIVAGNFGATAAANTLTIPGGMIIGAEYEAVVNVQGTTITVALVVSSSPGLTVKNTLFTGFNAAGTFSNNTSTFTATAESGSIVYTITAGTVTGSWSTFVLIPTSLF